MMRRYGRNLARLLMVCLYLGSSVAPSSGTAAAQDSNAASTNLSGGQFGKAKEVTFEVVSIRPHPLRDDFAKHFDPTPDGFSSYVTARDLVMLAYAPEDSFVWSLKNGTTDIRNAPGWLDDGYQVDARVSDESQSAWRNQGKRHELLVSALRALLMDRFNLALHEVPKQIPEYDLIVGKKGPKLEATPPGFTPPNGISRPGGAVVVPTRSTFQFYEATIDDLAWLLSRTSMHTVHDRTGLTGRYNYTVQIVPEPSSDVDDMVYNWPVSPLGLELKPVKGTGVTLIIDHIDMPSAN